MTHGEDGQGSEVHGGMREIVRAIRRAVERSRARLRPIEGAGESQEVERPERASREDGRTEDEGENFHWQTHLESASQIRQGFLP